LTEILSKIKNRVERDFQKENVAIYWQGEIDMTPFGRVNPFGCVIFLNMQQNLIEFAIYSENTNMESFYMPFAVTELVNKFLEWQKSGNLKIPGADFHSDELVYTNVVYLYTDKILTSKEEVKKKFLEQKLRLKIREYPNIKEEKRLAIVCANADYQFKDNLKNPINDSNKIIGTLKILGFEVLLLTNFKKDQLITKLDSISDKLSHFNEILFYYAGHGFYINGTHYIEPIDSQIKSITDLEEDGIRFDLIESALRVNHGPIRVFILDSCRLPTEWSYTPVPMERINESNTIITYSTSPGSAAKDGLGNNSPFTDSLSKNMLENNVSINQVFEKVKREVSEATNTNQVCWTLSSLQDEYMLNETKKFS
jgi:hypothetical protein